jgi:hypothetical protein
MQEDNWIALSAAPCTCKVINRPFHKKCSQQNVIGSDELPLSEKYPKYHKSVAGLDSIDVYRVHDLFNVTEPAIHHASKKLLMAGDRTGEKSMEDDIREARDTLTRWLDMKAEDGS